MLWKNWLAKLNAQVDRLLRSIALGLLTIYRTCFSSPGRPSCRFYPTCSTYAVEAFKKHNWFQALWLTTRRLLRCHPLGGWGYDPVPERKST